MRVNFFTPIVKHWKIIIITEGFNLLLFSQRFSNRKKLSFEGE